MTTDELRRLRVGLVLSGGGAKGAYQIGCWRALRKAGLNRFDALAGTSVGAINAVMIAANRCEEAERAWKNVRWSDVVGLNPAKVALLPFWLLGYLFSEFSPVAFLRRPAARTRRVFLTWFFTTGSPLTAYLKGIVTDEHVRAMKEARTPVYATISCYGAGPAHSGRWHGWKPQYIRLDRLPRQEILETLIKSAAFPGILSSGREGQSDAVDGGWTDSIPVAPLLFDVEPLDLIFVIRVNKHVAGKKVETGDEKTMLAWAQPRWSAHARKTDAAIRSPLPRVVTVIPSRNLGKLYTGTLLLSRPKIRQMMELGEADMTAVLASLTNSVMAEDVAPPNRNKRHGILAATVEPG